MLRLLTSVRGTGRASNNVEHGATGAAKADDVAAVLKDLEIPVAPTIIHHLSQFSAAFDRGLGVTELRPAGRAVAEIEALWLDLDKLAAGSRHRPRRRQSARRRRRGHD